MGVAVLLPGACWGAEAPKAGAAMAAAPPARQSPPAAATASTLRKDRCIRNLHTGGCDAGGYGDADDGRPGACLGERKVTPRITGCESSVPLGHRTRGHPAPCHPEL